MPTSVRVKRERAAARDTREAILQQAIRLFAANGYVSTSLDDIAAAVGIRKATIYHYISAKEDLLYAVNELLTSELLAEAEQLLSSADSPEAKLRGFFRAQLRLVAARQQEVTIFVTERHVLKSKSKRWREVVERREMYEKVLRDILQEGIRDHRFRKVPVRISALGILGMMSTVNQWYRADGDLSADEISEIFSDLVLNGLLVRK